MTDDPAAQDDPLEALLAEHREPAPDEPETAAPGDSDTGDPATGTEPSGLPEAPLFALLRNIEQDVGIDRIDRIWVFPPRRLEAGETAVVVVAAFPDIDADRRRVYAAHYTAREEASEPTLALDEYGTAPTDRVGRLVEEVVERIKDGPAGAPRSHDIKGSDERWNTVLHDLAESHLAEAQRNPRLRP